MRLPPGVSSKDFSSAIDQFVNAVGKEWVFTSDDDVNTYRDSYSPFWHEAEEPIPSAAVAPDGVEQVQAVVKIANNFKIPLWIISTGKNLGYGGSAPLLGGSVVLDLKRMDRIIEVNEKNHYALVEPGVSYFDLYRYIQDKGLKVLIDPADPGWGSLIGNGVDRGGGRTPMRDHFDAHCGMEIVLPDGEVVRTGMGALPDSKTWQQYRYGFGPYVDGLFSQSSLGVVTKMGFRLFPQPEAYLTGTVTVMKRDDLIPLVAGLAYLMNSGIVLGTTSVANPLAFARQDPALAALYAKPGGASTEELEQYAQEKNLGMWSIELPFYGPAKVVAAQWEHAKEKLSAIPSAKFTEGTTHRFPIKPDELPQFNSVAVGIPSLSVFGVGSARSKGHIWFSPIIPMTGEAILEAQKVFTDAYKELGMSMGPMFFLGPSSNYPRCFLVLFGFPIEHDVE
ncbi:MAG TPA: FAD-dependent oxidoreductase, partial [Verrucomicrobiae bacterium]|nr:FAD-dependent oxidoreductase [Verrucomicrobiae bacterium]